MKEFLTELELSEMVSIPRSTLRWRRFVGLGPAYVKIGRSVRYPVRAVREFIESNIHTPTTLAAVED
jgi:predicted DNA-binding transcriptional regulator AlpA